MDASVWVAKTGLTAQQRRMTVIANNLANVNTVGYKKDRAVFEDLLYQNIRQPGASADAQTIAPTGLMMGTGSRIIATEKLHEQGNMVATENALDIAIQVSRFINDAGLQPVGRNLYRETTASGPVETGTPGLAGFGELAQGSLEASNVNVVEEMVNMIETQRAYEVNSKAIAAADGMLRFLNQNL